MLQLRTLFYAWHIFCCIISTCMSGAVWGGAHLHFPSRSEYINIGSASACPSVCSALPLALWIPRRLPVSVIVSKLWNWTSFFILYETLWNNSIFFLCWRTFYHSFARKFHYRNGRRAPILSTTSAAAPFIIKLIKTLIPYWFEGTEFTLIGVLWVSWALCSITVYNVGPYWCWQHVLMLCINTNSFWYLFLLDKTPNMLGGIQH